MSKLAERVPAMFDTKTKVELVNGIVPSVADDDGRIDTEDLVKGIRNAIADLDVNEDLIIEEGRKAAAQQIASAWANQHTITLDRNQRVPVYQMQLGFAQSFFKIGSKFVPPASMLPRDFETMIDRQARRIANAQTDNTIWQEFYNRAKPGLERGENLVEQFESGTLELVAVSEREELASSNGDGENESE